MRKTRREGDLVIKTSSLHDEEWKKKLEKIMTVMEIPLFVKFIPNGYVTRFIDGTDLQGDKWFNYIEEEPLDLNGWQRRNVVKIFKDIVWAGIETGYLLADFTKRNVLLLENKAYLIDYDVIIEEMTEDYIHIFNEMLKFLKVPYTFNGDLKELYRQL